MSFKTLNLSPKLLATIEKLGYTSATEIQEKAIPLLLNGADILATSQTGTGKTAAFTLPLLDKLPETNQKRTGEERYKIDALILAPTRELVLQIQEKVEEYGTQFSHQSVALYGGIKLGSQVSTIRAGANIAVGTTARVLDHIKNGTLNLSEVKMVILDEADKMLEMGFIDEIRTIIGQLPKERQSLMFSATFPKPIMKLAQSFLKNPKIIEIDPENLSTKQVKQLVHLINEEEKMPLLSTLLLENPWYQVLIFTNTKLQADKIVTHLNEKEVKSKAIHGDKTQGQRVQALQEFKDKSIRVLVATDVAARGIDIINLPHVINFELPIKNEDYIHRIGRTGRAKQKGEARSLVCHKEVDQLREIEKLINKTLPTVEREDFLYEAKPARTLRKIKQQESQVDKKQAAKLKKAKELAEKMMSKGDFSKNKSKKSKKNSSKSPSNKRHF